MMAAMVNSAKCCGAVSSTGKPHGQRQLAFPGGSLFKGQFVEGKLHGRATQLFDDGSLYEGQRTERGLPHGLGSSFHPGGMRSEGEFSVNNRCGLGAQWNKDGQLILCGRWANNELVESCAVPLRLLPEGKFLSAAAQQAKRDHPNDSALMPNGTHYIGELNKQGQPHGEGASFHSDGSPAFSLLVDAADVSKSGRWIDGKVNGRAKWMRSPGGVESGLWRDGKLVRLPCVECFAHATHVCSQCEAYFCQEHCDAAHQLKLQQGHPIKLLSVSVGQLNDCPDFSALFSTTAVIVVDLASFAHVLRPNSLPMFLRTLLQCAHDARYKSVVKVLFLKDPSAEAPAWLTDVVTEFRNLCIDSLTLEWEPSGAKVLKPLQASQLAFAAQVQPHSLSSKQHSRDHLIVFASSRPQLFRPQLDHWMSSDPRSGAPGSKVFFIHGHCKLPHSLTAAEPSAAKLEAAGIALRPALPELAKQLKSLTGAELQALAANRFRDLSPYMERTLAAHYTLLASIWPEDAAQWEEDAEAGALDDRSWLPAARLQQIVGVACLWEMSLWSKTYEQPIPAAPRTDCAYFTRLPVALKQCIIRQTDLRACDIAQLAQTHKAAWVAVRMERPTPAIPSDKPLGNACHLWNAGLPCDPRLGQCPFEHHCQACEGQHRLSACAVNRILHVPPPTSGSSLAARLRITNDQLTSFVVWFGESCARSLESQLHQFTVVDGTTTFFFRLPLEEQMRHRRMLSLSSGVQCSKLQAGAGEDGLLPSEAVLWIDWQNIHPPLEKLVPFFEGLTQLALCRPGVSTIRTINVVIDRTKMPAISTELDRLAARFKISLINVNTTDTFSKVADARLCCGMFTDSRPAVFGVSEADLVLLVSGNSALTADLARLVSLGHRVVLVFDQPAKVAALNTSALWETVMDLASIENCQPGQKQPAAAAAAPAADDAAAIAVAAPSLSAASSSSDLRTASPEVDDEKGADLLNSSAGDDAASTHTSEQVRAWVEQFVEQIFTELQQASWLMANVIETELGDSAVKDDPSMETTLSRASSTSSPQRTMSSDSSVLPNTSPLLQLQPALPNVIEPTTVETEWLSSSLENGSGFDDTEELVEAGVDDDWMMVNLGTKHGVETASAKASQSAASAVECLPFCRECDGFVVATMRCDTCEADFCDAHTRAAHHMKQDQGHALNPIQTGDNSSITSLPSVDLAASIATTPPSSSTSSRHEQTPSPLGNSCTAAKHK